MTTSPTPSPQPPASEPARRPRPWRRLLRGLGKALLGITCACVVGWSALVLAFCLPGPNLVRQIAPAVLILGMLAAIIWMRPWKRVLLVAAGAFALGLIVFYSQIASNNRDWRPDVAVLPWADINGNKVTIHNIRKCIYRSETDYTPAYYDATFDLSKMTSVDFFLCYWSGPSIAHTMLSFGFDGGRYVCFSIETRKEKGEVYSAVKGFFRRYELTYVVADEVDVVKLRANFRGEQVYLYRLYFPLDRARLVFLDYLKTINHLKDQPEWYNALTSNCTTNIRGHARPYNPNAKMDCRILLNGYIDEMGYEQGTLDRSLPFVELKKRSLIDDLAKASDDDAHFSEMIRSRISANQR